MSFARTVEQPVLPASPSVASSGRRWLHRYAVAVAVCTQALIFAGALVTSTGSGLAVPDWPLSYGMLMPPMHGGIFYEHGHRLIAAFVGLLTIGLAVGAALVEPRRWVRRLAWAALGAVIVQGLLGGLTVLYRLPLAVSVSHGVLAQLFYCTTIVLAVVTSPRWLASRPAPRAGAAGRLLTLAPLASAAVLCQLVLGAVMRHSGAGLAIPDFPLMHGALWPDLRVPGATIHLAHRLWAAPTALLVVAAATLALLRPARPPVLSGAARSLCVLVVLQVALGATAVLTLRAVTPTTLHVAVGALILGLSVIQSAWAFRLAEDPASVATEAALRGGAAGAAPPERGRPESALADEGASARAGRGAEVLVGGPA